MRMLKQWQGGAAGRLVLTLTLVVVVVDRE